MQKVFFANLLTVIANDESVFNIIDLLWCNVNRFGYFERLFQEETLYLKTISL